MKTRPTLLLWAAACLALPAAALDLGDTAPPLERIRNWIEPRDPPADGGGTPLTAVVFWSARCPACRLALPHLNELRDRFADRGLLLAGIADEEEAEILAFLEQQPVRFRIAADPDRAAARDFGMGPGDRPYAFVVDAHDRIVWHGHPMAGLEDAIRRLVEGPPEPEAVHRRETKIRALADALARENLAAARTLLEELIAGEGPEAFHRAKAAVLFRMGDSAALADHFRQMEERFRHSIPDLNDLAWMLAAPSPVPLPDRDLPLAWRAARRAHDLAGGRDPAVLDTMALVYYAAGLPERAAETQARAVAIERDPEQRRELERTLEFYRGVVRLRDRILGAE